MSVVRSLVRCALGLAVLLGLGPGGARPARAVVFHGTANPAYNTNAPGGTLTNSGWQYVGFWNSYVGTLVGPRHFLTARHIGGQVGDPFFFQGRTYTTLAFVDDPAGDLRLVQVCGTLPAPHAPLYTNFNETSKSVVVMGRGTQRGAEVRVGGVLKGWEWGPLDGVLRWGENRIVGPVPSGSTNFLQSNFDATGGSNEVHLSNGDSGGPLFIKEGADWKLAGVNYAVEGPFNLASSGDGFYGALFDKGGLHYFSDSAQAWVLIPDQVSNLPSAFYATRVSLRVPWIQSVLAQPVPPDPAPSLESADSLGGSFSAEPAAVVNPTDRTITVPVAGPRRFYRLSGCGPYRLRTVATGPSGVVLAYE